MGADRIPLRLWDLETGKELRKLEGHAAKMAAGIFSPGGNEILTFSLYEEKVRPDPTLHLWDAETGKNSCRNWKAIPTGK